MNNILYRRTHKDWLVVLLGGKIEEEYTSFSNAPQGWYGFGDTMIKFNTEKLKQVTTLEEVKYDVIYFLQNPDIDKYVYGKKHIYNSVEDRFIEEFDDYNNFKNLIYQEVIQYGNDYKELNDSSIKQILILYKNIKKLTDKYNSFKDFIHGNNSKDLYFFIQNAKQITSEFSLFHVLKRELKGYGEEFKTEQEVIALNGLHYIDRLIEEVIFYPKYFADANYENYDEKLLAILDNKKISYDFG